MIQILNSTTLIFILFLVKMQYYYINLPKGANRDEIKEEILKTSPDAQVVRTKPWIYFVKSNKDLVYMNGRVYGEYKLLAAVSDRFNADNWEDFAKRGRGPRRYKNNDTSDRQPREYKPRQPRADGD